MERDGDVSTAETPIFEVNFIPEDTKENEKILPIKLTGKGIVIKKNERSYGKITDNRENFVIWTMSLLSFT